MAIKYDDKNIKAYSLMGESLVTLAEHTKDKSKIELAIEKLKKCTFRSIKSTHSLPEPGQTRVRRKIRVINLPGEEKTVGDQLWRVTAKKKGPQKLLDCTYFKIMQNLVETDDSLEEESKDQYE